MEYQKYITLKKELSDKFHCFIKNEDSLDENYQNLISFIDSENYQANSNEFKLILHMINRISNSHHRYPTFFDKIEKLLSSFSEYIKQSFTNFELFNIFQNNKRILHFLFKNNLITVDESIAKLIMKKDERRHFFVRYFDNNNADLTNESRFYFNKKQQAYKNTIYYFFTEIKLFLDEEKRREIEEQILSYGENIFDIFEYNRQIGENDSYICQLIRKDSIKEFCIYVNKNNLSLSIEIPDSIFETNPFLLKKRSSLIEYSAFFGSIQIFQYLSLNGVELTPSLWLYAIHGNNPEIIHLLEENHIKPEDKSYFECLRESIKCHHNDIANYILLNLMKKEDFDHKNYFENNQCACGFHFHNYNFIQNSTNFRFIFYYACLYDYFEIAKLLIKANQIDLSYKVIQTYIFLIQLYTSLIYQFFNEVLIKIAFEPILNIFHLIGFHYYLNYISLLFVNSILKLFFLITFQCNHLNKISKLKVFFFSYNFILFYSNEIHISFLYQFIIFCF